MSRMAMVWVASALLLAGCATPQAEAPAAKPAAAGHAAMPMGGAADSSRAGSRQAVHLTGEQARALGVSYLTVGQGSMSREIRTVGEVVAPESTLATITPKIEGFVEHLFVNYTGQSVRRGEPLLTLYSPALVAAEQELLTARRLAAEVDSTGGDAARYAAEMLRAARQRLAFWDITGSQISRIESSGEVQRTLTLVAPFDGIVLDKAVVEGQRVMPGMPLYHLADLRTVWIEGDVFEQDLSYVKLGSRATFELEAYPGQEFTGRVSFVFPTVDSMSRTGRVRLTTRNPGLRLRPGMYATLHFDAQVGRNVVVVPRNAVVMTGERNLVFVRDSSGMLMPRDVVLGARTDSQAEILRGLAPGERIVASANFLVDAESQLSAPGAGGGMANMPGMAGMGGAGAAPGVSQAAMPAMPDMERRP
jgi:Cu(I)/Ag(I) efflux system membrane fusion protein